MISGPETVRKRNSAKHLSRNTCILRILEVQCRNLAKILFTLTAPSQLYEVYEG
jgi:hypothetical protein